MAAHDYDSERWTTKAPPMRDSALDPRTVFFGEVGLAGEIRGISQAEARVKEAGKLGFERCVLPASGDWRTCRRSG